MNPFSQALNRREKIYFMFYKIMQAKIQFMNLTIPLRLDWSEPEFTTFSNSRKKIKICLSEIKYIIYF